MKNLIQIVIGEIIEPTTAQSIRLWNASSHPRKPLLNVNTGITLCAVSHFVALSAAPVTNTDQASDPFRDLRLSGFKFS